MTIGFYADCLINRIGPKEDVLAFFLLVEELVVKKYPETDWSLITDRFYKRYLRWEDLETASLLMQRIQEIFAVNTADTVDWNRLEVFNQNFLLKFEKKNLLGMLDKIFIGFEGCKDICVLEHNKSGKYIQPLRVVVSDIPEFMKDKFRSLADYDNLEGEPFWLR